MTEPFSLVVVPDSQYLFDGDRRRPELLELTFEHLAMLQRMQLLAPVRHVIHVGDVTEHGSRAECETAGSVLADCLDRLGVETMTVVAGNHDVEHHSDETRGDTAFKAVFGPDTPGPWARPASEVRYSPHGYCSWRVLSVPGGASLAVLAMDWRPSKSGWSWARDLLERHRGVPTIVVTHDIAHAGALTRHGERVEELLRPYPDVFLVLGGHEWPSTRVVSGEREYHAVNYQELPAGGAGAVRVYQFEPDHGHCDVISLCPALQVTPMLHSVTARRRLALSREEDQFRFQLPATLGGGLDRPWQSVGLSLVADIVPDGVTQFDATLPERFTIELSCRLPALFPDRWQVLLARAGAAPDGSPEPLAALSLSTENFIGWMAFVTEQGEEASDRGRAVETWATSHECPAGTETIIVVSNGAHPGVWVDGDQVDRVDRSLGGSLVPGPWRWRVGEGIYAGEPADPFTGTVTRVRFWG